MGLMERFRRFMSGRYGNDNLNNFLMIVAFVLILVNMFVRQKHPTAGLILSGLIVLLLVLTYLRMFSRKIDRRTRENQKYLEIRNKVFSPWNSKGSRTQAQKAADRAAAKAERAQRAARPRSDAEHRIFRCPACDQRVRVPRGRGKILITCPRCGKEFEKRS
ncbi:MAG: hypothetical protein ILP12_05055 [Lachnospiraceae bacterium]|nr:hypothetical protein [Lachnospiraceae bacterium]